MPELLLCSQGCWELFYFGMDLYYLLGGRPHWGGPLCGGFWILLRGRLFWVIFTSLLGGRPHWGGLLWGWDFLHWGRPHWGGPLRGGFGFLLWGRPHWGGSLWGEFGFSAWSFLGASCFSFWGLSSNYFNNCPLRVHRSLIILLVPLKSLFLNRRSFILSSGSRIPIFITELFLFFSSFLLLTVKCIRSSSSSPHNLHVVS